MKFIFVAPIPASSGNMAGSSLRLVSENLLESALAEFEAQSREESVTISNEAVVGFLDSVEALYNKKVELNKHLARAYFSLMCARKNDVHKFSVEDAREEIEASVRLQNDRQGGAGWVHIERDIDHLESLSLLNGLPGARLRSCQREFRKALDLVIEVDRLTREVEAEIARRKR